MNYIKREIDNEINKIVRELENMPPNLTIPSVPPSDNKRKTKNRWTGELVTNPAVAQFRIDVGHLLKDRDIPNPPPPPALLFYKVYYPKSKGRYPDQQNCCKTLIDAIYPDDDEFVSACPIPGRYIVSAYNRRVEVWWVKFE